MPIVISDYTWEETTSKVTVTVPLTGVSRKKIDVHVTALLVKLNASPYVLTLDLLDEVDPEESSCAIGDGEVVFTLIKCEPGLWGTLVINAEDIDKKQLFERREKSNEDARNKEQEKAKALEQKREADAKYAREQQWELERQEREKLASEKAAQREQAEKELYAWREKATREADDVRRKATVPSSVFGTEGVDSDDEDGGEYEDITRPYATGATSRADHRVPRRDITDRDIESSSESDSDSGSDSRDGPMPKAAIRPKAPEYVPPVRATGTAVIRTGFTAQAPKIAMRTKPEEVEHKPKTPVVEPEKDQSETNPAWIKDKGDTLFKKGDWQGALNAYTGAIALAPTMWGAFMNRAAAYLKKGDFDNCCLDCTHVLDHLPPEPPRGSGKEDGDRPLRIKAHVRRGSAHFEAGRLQYAVNDYETAVRMQPGNEGLVRDLQKMKALLSAKPKS